MVFHNEYKVIMAFNLGVEVEVAVRSSGQKMILMIKYLVHWGVKPCWTKHLASFRSVSVVSAYFDSICVDLVSAGEGKAVSP